MEQAFDLYTPQYHPKTQVSIGAPDTWQNPDIFDYTRVTNDDVGHMYRLNLDKQFNDYISRAGRLSLRSDKRRVLNLGDRSFVAIQEQINRLVGAQKPDIGMRRGELQEALKGRELVDEIPAVRIGKKIKKKIRDRNK